MVDKIRVFVSHHHSPDEDTFTARLVEDLVAAGADVWVDDQRITSDDFIKKINEGLAGRQWLVLVMTPGSLRSPWVQAEVNAGLNQVRKGRMLGVVPIVVRPCDDEDIPPLLDALHRYDATSAYEPARDGLLRALNLSMPLPTRQSEQSPTDPTPKYPLPDVPERLASLGFRGINVTGTPAIIPPLVTISAGPFLMGSKQAEDNLALDNELPQHSVEVGTFQISKYPVTVAEYAFAVDSEAVREPPETFGVTWQMQQERPDHPVVCVSGQDAMAYIAWLISITGQLGWRLPTEAEWEKASRWDAQHGVSRIYPWGDSFDKDRCNTSESEIGATTPVGSYPASDANRSGASSFGVEDMAGNVWEWTSSVFRHYPYTADDDREDSESTDNRTLHGGSWGYNAWFARSAFRDDLTWGALSDQRGFRLVCTPEVDSSSSLRPLSAPSPSEAPEGH